MPPGSEVTAFVGAATSDHSMRIDEGGEFKCDSRMGVPTLSPIGPRQGLPPLQSSGSSRKFWRSNSLTVADLHVESDVLPRSALTDISTLGKGAFGEVKLCVYRNAQGKNVKVAVKEVLPECRGTKDLDLFLSECQLLKRLQHRSLVRFIATGFELRANPRDVAPKQLFNVQEYCDAGSLREMVEKQMRTMSHRLKVYTPVAALEWVIHVAEALTYLHGLNPMVIHRDLKLDNILLSTTLEEGEEEGGGGSELKAKLADFGLSKSIAMKEQAGRQLYRRSSAADVDGQNMMGEMPDLPDLQKGGRMLAPSITFGQQAVKAVENIKQQLANMTGQAGSFTYMAPEVFRGEQYNEKVDVFSLAIIMYELFTGITMSTKLMIAGSVKEFELHAIRTSQGQRLPLPTNLPEDLKRAISEMWHHDVARRPSAAVAAEMLRDLRPVMQEWHEAGKSRWLCFK
eukprot:jgi/Tetstr1/457037/TSEL_043700.t1